MSTITNFTCTQCRITTKTESALRNHKSRLHTLEVTVEVNGVEQVVMRNDSGKFSCPVCSKSIAYTDSFKTHLQRHEEANQLSDDNHITSDSSTSDGETEATVATLSSRVQLTPTARPTKKPREQREYSSALLSAMDALDLPKEEQHKKLLAAELFDLEPIAYFDHHSNEHNFLGTSRTIAGLLSSVEDDQTARFRAVVPMKRSRSGEDSSVDQPPVLYHMIATSQWKRALAGHAFVELDNHVAQLMNMDWTRRPWLRYFCARVMEDMLFINDDKALLVNCAEVYCRLPSIDAHHEPLAEKRNQSLQSSLPHCDTRYPNVELTILKNTDNSEKLVLGTKSINYLITSSIRIDIDQIPVVGPSSLNGFTVSKATQIFLPKANVDELCSWVTQSSQTPLSHQKLYPFDDHAQLRQLRSKFHRQSTYTCSRSCSKHTNDIRTRPATIWTLADCTCRSVKEMSDGKIASMLFKEIAVAVWNKGDKALLTEKIVSELKLQCSEKGKVRKDLEAIETLFLETSAVSIIGNQMLNKQLVVLANRLSPYINKANEHVALAVYQRYKDIK